MKALGNIAFAVFMIGVIGLVGWKVFLKTPDDPVQAQTMDPRGALERYLLVAYEFGNQSKNFADVEDTVSKEDYQWFQDNYERLAGDDPHGILGAINPTESAVIKRHAVLEGLLSSGPNGPRSQILDNPAPDIGSDYAKFTVRQHRNYGGATDYVVTLVKEGRFWRVDNFAGGMDRMQNTVSDGQIVSRSMEEVLRSTGVPRGHGLDQDTIQEYEAMAAELGIPVTGGGGGEAPAEAAAMAPPPGATDNPVGDLAAAGQAPAPPRPQPAQTAGPGGVPMAPAGQPAMPAAGNQTAYAPQAGAAALPPSASTPQAQQALQRSQQLIGQAAQYWGEQRYQESLASAEQALQIRTQVLGANHDQTQEVQRMVTAAQQMLQTQPTQ